MGTFLEYAAIYKKEEDVTLDAFTSDLQKQFAALRDDKLNRRSWVKDRGNGFTITLGKLPGEYELKDKDAALQFLNRAIQGVREDDDFVHEIRKAYGGEVESAPIKKPRKKRAVRLDD